MSIPEEHTLFCNHKAPSYRSNFTKRLFQLKTEKLTTKTRRNHQSYTKIFRNEEFSKTQLTKNFT